MQHTHTDQMRAFDYKPTDSENKAGERCSENGAGERSRTPDLRITNALLYRLSYTGGNGYSGTAAYPDDDIHPVGFGPVGQGRQLIQFELIRVDVH